MSDTTLRAVIDRYLDQILNHHTRKSYRDVLRPFAVAFGPERPLATVTVQDIEHWDRLQADSAIARETHMSRRKHLKAFFNWCVRHELLEASPSLHLVIKKRRVSMAAKAIPADVLTAMLSAVREKPGEFARARDTAILALIATFGARAGDVASLRLGNVSIREGWIVLDTKGDNDLRLPLPPRTAQLLDEWLVLRGRAFPDPPHSFVFVNNRTTDGARYQPLVSSSISKMIERLAQTVCGQTYGPHSIRHRTAQSLADQGVPPTVVQAILGHSSVTITLEYYYNQDYDRAAAVLRATELAGAPQRESKAAKILKVDFSRLIG